MIFRPAFHLLRYDVLHRVFLPLLLLGMLGTGVRAQSTALRNGQDRFASQNHARIRLEGVVGTNLAFRRRTRTQTTEVFSTNGQPDLLLGVRSSFGEGQVLSFGVGLYYLQDRAELDYRQSAGSLTLPNGQRRFDANSFTTRQGTLNVRENWFRLTSTVNVQLNRWTLRGGLGLNVILAGQQTYDFTQTTTAYFLPDGTLTLPEPAVSTGRIVYPSTPQSFYLSIPVAVDYRLTQQLRAGLQFEQGLHFFGRRQGSTFRQTRLRAGLMLSYAINW